MLLFNTCFSQPKCHHLHNIQFIFVSVQRTALTSDKIFLQIRIMVDGAKFNSHDSDGHFKSRLLKMAAAGKINIAL